MAKAKVCALKVKPQTILSDIERLCDLAGMSSALDKGATTILKDNISWHYPFPGANTTPWQMEGTILALRNAGYQDISCVQNKTVVTNAFKGEDLNHYVPLFKKYNIPVLYNFKDEDMKWIEYRPKARLHVLHEIFPEGIRIPDYFVGKNVLHMPTIKCVAGDTEVTLEDGTMTTIREVVAGQIAKASVALLDSDGACHVEGAVRLLAMAPDGSVQPFTAVAFSRSRCGSRRVVRITTRAGRTLTASAEHLVKTPGGWTKVSELSVSDRLALGRRVRIAGTAQALPQTHAMAPVTRISGRAGRKYSLEFVQGVLDQYQAGRTVTAIAANGGVRWQTVQSILHRHDVALRRNVVPIRIPERTSPEFWRWMGYVMAEGCVERSRSCDKLWWVNSEPAIRADFTALTRELFGLEARPHPNGKHQYVYSSKLGRFLEELGLPIPLNAGNKLIPKLLFRCSDREIAAFLSAYLDGDGCVSARQAAINVTTKSEELAKGVCSLFARLGAVAIVRPVKRTIPGRWSEPRSYYMVTVSGAQVEIVARMLEFRHPEKQARMEQHVARLATSKKLSNWDTVPVPRRLFRSIREGLGLTYAATGRASSANSIEHGHTSPTPQIARYFVDVFEKADTANAFSHEIAELRRLSHADLAWDVVTEIEELPADPAFELFDVTVPGADSFLANGLVAHNCHIYTTTTGAMKNAFGGLLNTKRHYTHTWIHRTLVDLLAIQKEIHSGIFAVMDGTTAGNGPGPRTMFPVIKDYMLASADQVAIDAVAAKMMGFDPLSLEFIKVAHDDGLGVGDPRDIEIVGDDISGESWGFSVGDNAASKVGDVLWFGPLKKFQKLFFHTPLVNVFIFGSEAYHDYYRWPRKDSQVFEDWKASTHWGKLFEAYGRGESERITRSSEAGVAAPAK